MTPELRKIWENKPKRWRLILSHLDERDGAEVDVLSRASRSSSMDRVKFHIVQAAKAKDEDWWDKLVKANPSYARFALQQWNKKRRRGERSAQLDPVERQRLKFALQDVKRIRQFCKATFGRSNGRFAYEIAAERNSISVERLMRQIKKSKNRRPK